MVTIVAAAVKNAPWQGSDGIITEGVSLTSNNDGVGFKGMKSPIYHGDTVYLSILPTAIFIRGLAEVFARNPSNNALRILLHSYTDVQVGDSVVEFREHLRLISHCYSTTLYLTWQLMALAIRLIGMDHLKRSLLGVNWQHLMYLRAPLLPIPDWRTFCIQLFSYDMTML
jgi:hypothetical protein